MITWGLVFHWRSIQIRQRILLSLLKGSQSVHAFPCVHDVRFPEVYSFKAQVTPPSPLTFTFTLKYHQIIPTFLPQTCFPLSNRYILSTVKQFSKIIFSSRGFPKCADFNFTGLLLLLTVWFIQRFSEFCSLWKSLFDLLLNSSVFFSIRSFWI